MLWWVAEHRVWLIPLFCALFVVIVEVGVGLAGRTLPLEAHGVLGAFWVYTVGRTGQREGQVRRRRARVSRLMRSTGLSPGTSDYDVLAALVDSEEEDRGG